MTSEIDRIAEERRQKMLARIAKHNGTTVAEAAASVTEPGGLPVDDDREYPTPEDARAAEAARAARAREAIPVNQNPALTALTAIGIIAVVIGVILLVVGAANAANYRGGDSGLGEIAWGGSITGLGISALILLLTAHAIIRGVKNLR